MTVVSDKGHDISGTTAQRPTNAEPGMTFYDTTLETLYCANSAGSMRSVPGHIGIATIAAAGTNQATATALTAGNGNNVTGADGVKGVLLPTLSLGDTIQIANASSSALLVYPTGTNTINGGSASASVSIPANGSARFFAATTTNWSALLSSAGGAVTTSGITGTATPFPIAGLAAAQGGSVSVTGGTSSTSGNAGGAVSLVGGTPGATGAGGAITVTSGAGGSTSGAAGAISISVGSCTSGVGASITLTAGNGATGTNGGGNINLVPGTAVSTGTPGELQVNGNAQMIFVSEALTATDATRTLAVITRPCRLKAVSAVFTTGSTSGTVTLEKATGTTAPGSGTALLTGTVALSGTANTVANGTLIATVASITFAAGDRLNMVIAGTMTNLVGCRVTAALAAV